jgi:DNA-binding MarR family transcriptional regulator
MLKYVILKSFTMKEPTNGPSRRISVATDEDGHLYSPEMRDVIGARVPPEAQPAVEAFAAINVAARHLHTRMERWCEREGLSETRLGILLMLRHAGAPVPMGALAGRLHVTPRNVTGLIDHLERDGLVARVPDPADRRSILARLTERGTERVDAMGDVTFRQQRVLLAGFTDDELVQMRHLCLKLASRIQEADFPD